jgi:hypothetical protein
MDAANGFDGFPFSRRDEPVDIGSQARLRDPAGRVGRGLRQVISRHLHSVGHDDSHHD